MWIKSRDGGRVNLRRVDHIEIHKEAVSAWLGDQLVVLFVGNTRAEAEHWLAQLDGILDEIERG